MESYLVKLISPLENQKDKEGEVENKEVVEVAVGGGVGKYNTKKKNNNNNNTLIINDSSYVLGVNNIKYY